MLEDNLSPCSYDVMLADAEGKFLGACLEAPSINILQCGPRGEEKIITCFRPLGGPPPSPPPMNAEMEDVLQPFYSSVEVYQAAALPDGPSYDHPLLNTAGERPTNLKQKLELYRDAMAGLTEWYCRSGASKGQVDGPFIHHQ